jgi:hypothetical protein
VACDSPIDPNQKGTRQVKVSHAPSALSASFDDSSLVSCAGLVPVLELAQRCGLADLVAQRVTVAGTAGANAPVKITGLVAGMVAGADSIDDMDLLRHGAMGRLFTGVRAPSTLGTFLRSFRFGHVRQLDAVAAAVLARLAAAVPLLPGADSVAYIDVDDTLKQTYGYTKQGAGYGYTGVKGINALLATVSTPTAAPVICAARLRKGSANSARGAARLVADALIAAARAGADPTAGTVVIVRADSAYYGRDVIAAARRHGARFSITARQDPAVRRAIAAIPDQAWTPIRYPNAIWDEDQQRLISDAEVAEIPFTAFTSHPPRHHVPGRLIVRRVRDANPDHVVVTAQGELFPAWRHHALFTDSPLGMLDAEAAHRGHAVIEQVIADLKSGPIAHLPSSSFNANGAWLVLATIAFNLTRAAGCLASGFHARATTATIRRQLINVPARIARSARRITLHLPTAWPWTEDWLDLFATVHAPPRAA